METKVMGVLRLVPDAFADNGRSGTRAAVTHGRHMISEGADIVEIACTPHAEPPQAEQVVSVVGALSGDARVAVATGSPTLAAAATAAGATLICDHSMLPGAAGVDAREALVGVAAEAGAGWVAVHAATPAPATGGEPVGGTVAEALASLEAQADRASAAGLSEIYLDPGIGCGGSPEADLDLLGGLERLAALGRPLVVGIGDGRLIDELHAAADTGRLPVPDAAGEHDADRLEGALVVAVWAMLAGAAVLRTHHVAATLQAARIVGARQPVGTS
ncbi:MAG: dihydropteroate synthase [Acidimicrobiia bacterium]|nr:dihydropteroate synthase [Acidimicrobiia bacterium]